jgi:hypothetical protein
MVDKLVRGVLELSDDSKGSEFPEGSSRTSDQATTSVRRIHETLKVELGVSMELDDRIEDASFHAELTVLHPEPFHLAGGTVYAPEIAIRFSNFGKLYSITSSMPELLARYPLEKIRALIESHGWIYVPADQLDEVYDGKNAALRNGVNTWWIRFFDYL